jgi:hypothetical protein
MTALNLEHDNYTRTRVGYFVVAPAKDHDDADCEAVIERDPTASGCNPHRWALRKNINWRGHEFASHEEALQNAKYADGSYGSYDLSMVDKSSACVIAVKFVQTQTAEVVDDGT